MADHKTVSMGLGKNLALKNLQENPNAVYVIMEPSEKAADRKGWRVYLMRRACDTAESKLGEKRAKIAKKGGYRECHQDDPAAVTFEVQEVGPMVDFGQTWEKSIQQSEDQLRRRHV